MRGTTNSARILHIADDFTNGIPAGDGRICKVAAK
jgi:hypothetical protein